MMIIGKTVFMKFSLNQMKKHSNRRDFLRNTAMAGVGLGLATDSNAASFINSTMNEGKRVGMIGLDTSHCTAFTKALNDPSAGNEFGGYRVVAAYPNGTIDIEDYVKKIPEFTKEVKEQGVEIVGSIEELLDKVDVVLLTCIDGNRHLEQTLPVLKAGKRLFIDKPMAASLKDAITIFETANHYNVPIFSSSSLRYINGSQEIANGKIGKVKTVGYWGATLKGVREDYEFSPEYLTKVK